MLEELRTSTLEDVVRKYNIQDEELIARMENEWIQKAFNFINLHIN